MAEQEIVELLEKTNRPMTLKEIAEKLQIGRYNVLRALKQMEKYSEIIRERREEIKEVQRKGVILKRKYTVSYFQLNQTGGEKNEID